MVTAAAGGPKENAADGADNAPKAAAPSPPTAVGVLTAEGTDASGAIAPKSDTAVRVAGTALPKPNEIGARIPAIGANPVRAVGAAGAPKTLPKVASAVGGGSTPQADGADAV